MEDPWGNSVWSVADSEKTGDSSKDLVLDPKWNSFDADENTIDVGVPSWSAASDSGWGEGTNLWHAESSTLDVWKPSLSTDAAREEPDLELEGGDATEQEDEKSPEPRPILPTPPLSPLPPPSAATPAVDTPPSCPPRPLINPPSPDPFGSFESGELVSEASHDASSWTPKTPHFPSGATNEPWGASWGGDEKEDQGGDEEQKDEWELAQEARLKLERKVPPELLDSLVKQWDEFATNLYPNLNTEHSESQSWRKGLDSIEGLAELVDSLIPGTSFPPPLPPSKTAVAKSVKETLRLTRSFPLSQSSPMAHLYASKGSTDWEKSVKAQKTAANDEWGWDLKHEPEEKLEATDSAKDKKGGGLLSFWGRKTSSIPSTPAGDLSTMNPPKSPTVMTKSTSPATSARPSIDSTRTASPMTATIPNSSLPAADVDIASSDAPSAQPSAVSRFFNRFSRKPSSVTTISSGKEKHTSLSLSSDDLSFLSEMTPSTTEGSLQSDTESTSANSLGALISWPRKSSSSNSGKLPHPLAPPPPPSSRSTNPVSTNSPGSDTSFDAKMANAQLMDLLDMAMGPGHSVTSGYAPVTIDVLESPVEGQTPLPAIQSPKSPHPLPASSLSSWVPPIISPIVTSKSQTPSSILHNARDSPRLPSVSVPPIPPPHTPDGPSRPRQSIALSRFYNPLPPTPKRDLDDLAEFLSASPLSGRSTPPHSPLLPQPGSSSTRISTTTSLLSSVSNRSNSVSLPDMDDPEDFGDFGDFISTPLRTPSPPRVPPKTFKSTNHKPTLELVEKAASRPGRWPAPPSPSPPTLAPPPGSLSNMGYFDKLPSQQLPSQLDLLTSDNSPAKATSLSGTLPSQAAALPQPLFAGPPSRPASTAFGMAPAPLPASSSTPRTLLPPSSAPSKPAGASGLSAQDLSFFEGL